MSADKHKKKDHRDRGSCFTIGVEKRPDVKKPEKFKTRLCPDCAETTLDDDGEVIAHYVTELHQFIEDKPKGRKAELCPVCNKKKIRKRDRERRKKEREQLIQQDRSDCSHFADCLEEFSDKYKTADEMQREQCFDCVEYERP